VLRRKNKEAPRGEKACRFASAAQKRQKIF
jgi:hypothetical protein